MVDFVRDWSARTEICIRQMLGWIPLSERKFRDWRGRYGKANEHNALVPRDHWIEQRERLAIIEYFGRYPLEGYRRLCFMMLDQDIVAVSPACAGGFVWKVGGAVEPIEAKRVLRSRAAARLRLTRSDSRIHRPPPQRA